jgi:hypothetical protein
MSSVQVLPLGNYANGVHGPFGPIDIADDVISVDISIARCTTATPTIWPNASTIVDVLPEISVDGGTTWSEAGRATSNGGISFGKGGVEVANMLAGGSLPQTTARKYRVTVTISGGPLRSSASIEVN